MNLFKRIAMLAGVAGPIVLKFIPGPLGTALGFILTGVGGLAALNHPTPAAVAEFGDKAK